MHPKHQAAIDAFGEFWIARVKCIAEVTKPTGLQFHYTRSILAVENIIRTNTIWFGDIRQMNDEVELRYGLELYQDEALQIAETRASVCERVCRYMSEPSKRDGVFAQIRFFSASFGRPNSEHMWKSYADDGKGFALGFRPERFDPTENSNEVPLDRRYFTGSVRYDETAIRSLHREAIEHALDLILRTSSDPRFQEEPKFIRRLATEVLLDAVVTSITSKPQKWSGEEERRLYYPVDKDREHLHKVHEFNGRSYLHMKVEQADLAEVVAGVNTTEEDRFRIQKALDESGRPHIRIKLQA